MLCHPKTIKELPEYKKFKVMEERIAKITLEKSRLEKEQESKFFKDKRIFIVPSACNSSCRYWEECREEIKKGRKKINN